MQNQSNSLITFDTQLKTALRPHKSKTDSSQIEGVQVLKLVNTGKHIKRAFLILIPFSNLPIKKKEQECRWKVHGRCVGIFTKSQENDDATNRRDCIVDLKDRKTCVSEELLK